MIVSLDCLFSFFWKWIFFFDCAPNKKWRVSWVKWRWNHFDPIFQNSTMIFSNCFGLKWFFINEVWILKCFKATWRSIFYASSLGPKLLKPKVMVPFQSAHMLFDEFQNDCRIYYVYNPGITKMIPLMSNKACHCFTIWLFTWTLVTFFGALNCHGL